VKIRFIALGLILILFGLLVTTLPVTSPTVDEPMYMVRGYAFVSRGQDRMAGCGPCSPVLSSALGGVALLLEPHLKPLPPVEDAIWSDDGGTGIFEYFVWSPGAPTSRIIFLTRLPIIFVTVLLGALIFRWAAQRSGAMGAAGALAFYVFCPNILAHGRLVTADVVTAATFTLSAYAFDQALRTSRRTWRAFSGLALGLALASKVSAAALPLAFLGWTVIAAWPRRQDRSVWRGAGVTLLSTILLGGFTLWGLYRFSIGPIEPGGPIVPVAAYWADWQAVMRNQTAPLPAYLFGEISTHGWWYYYLVTFFVKSPLPVLLLTSLTIIRLLRMRQWSRDLPLLIVPAAIFGGLLFSTHNLGYRYVLPVLPFIYVASADVIAAAAHKRWKTIGIMLLLAWQIVGTLAIYPHYLAFFNEAVGGPERGRFVLSDSNLDWGQDLPALKAYLDQNGIADFNFSYFGGIDPAVYGIQGYALPPVRAAMHTHGPWWLHRFYPPDPAPGVYAVSASNLMGGAWLDQQTFAALSRESPVASLGHSILIYNVPARGPAVSLSLAGLQIDQIDPETFRLFGTNDVRPRWFDATSSLIAAPGETWIAVADDQPIGSELKPLFDGVRPLKQVKLTDEDRSFTLYHFDLAQRITQAAQRATPVSAKFGDTTELLGYDIAPHTQGLALITYWRVGEDVVAPLQMFVHALGPEDSIVAQTDRLDAMPYGWRPDDVIAQVHVLDWATDWVGTTLAIGLYNPANGERLPVLVDAQPYGDSLRLKVPGVQ
jgi:hypothetical protein